MRIQRLLILPLLALAGCYTYAPVEVHVTNADTKLPMAGVHVGADYRRFMEFFPPKMETAVTDAQGVARLDVCTNYSKSGDVAELHIRDEGYFVAQPRPSTTVELSTAAFRAASGSPYRVEIELLSIAAYRLRYPNR